MSIAENLAQVKARVAAAAKACGRDEKDILLIGASKMNDADTVREAIAAGLPACGENRVQELRDKNAVGAYEGAELHFIGTLQKKRGCKAADILYETLVKYGCLERTVVGTFHNEITAYVDETYPDLPRSAGFNEAIRFYLYSFFNLPAKKDTFPFVALQIPTDDYTVNLGTSRVINYAHKLNIAVQYWTINDPEEMAKLQAIGADCIMTDVPNVAAEILVQPE